MKKQLIMIGIMFLLLAIGFSGCNSTDQKPEQSNDEENRFIGIWEGSLWVFNTTITRITLNESLGTIWIDNEGTMAYHGTYSYDDTTIRFRFKGIGATLRYKFVDGFLYFNENNKFTKL